MLALALVVAGVPLAHAMPEHAMPDAPAMQAAEAMHHHHDGMAMDATPDVDDTDQSGPAAPCKCLNCSLCAVSATVSPLRLAFPDRRVAAVVYRTDARGIAGVAGRVEPGIPIPGL